jgi:hypothetical protein
MPTYRKADKGHQAHGLIQSIVADHYPDLSDDEADASFDVLLAWPNEGMGNCLTFKGHPADVTIRATGHKERAKGSRDVEIIIDANRWEEWDEEKRAAALDGALAYLEVQKDKEGVVKVDKGNRPKLKLIEPDFFLAGFAAVAERHGESSLEVSSAKAIVDRFGQQLFPWMATGAVA